MIIGFSNRYREQNVVCININVSNEECIVRKEINTKQIK